jgi:dsDNA-specific endonuclease/ATPase MutS2
MDPRSLELLELPEILERLAAVAASEPGKHRCLALEPAADVDEVERRQALTTETVRLLEESAEPELAEVRDVRHAVEVAARGSTLDTGTLWAIAVSIDAAIAARAAVEPVDVPGLRELVRRIETSLGQVSEPIRRAAADDGSDLRGGASPALRRLRRPFHP